MQSSREGSLNTGTEVGTVLQDIPSTVAGVIVGYALIGAVGGAAIGGGIGQLFFPNPNPDPGSPGAFVVYVASLAGGAVGIVAGAVVGVVVAPVAVVTKLIDSLTPTPTAPAVTPMAAAALPLAATTAAPRGLSPQRRSAAEPTRSPSKLGDRTHHWSAPVRVTKQPSEPKHGSAGAHRTHLKAHTKHR